MIKELAMKWPVMRQIFEGGDGTGREAMSDATKNLRPKNEGAQVARSVCPYCAVGCGQQIFHKDGKLISIEGDPHSPVSRGTIVPEGVGQLRIADAFEARDEGEISPAVWDGVGIAGSGYGDEDDRGSGVGEPREKFCRDARPANLDADEDDRPSGRRDARQRRKLSDQKTVLRRTGDGVHLQSGQDMT